MPESLHSPEEGAEFLEENLGGLRRILMMGIGRVITELFMRQALMRMAGGLPVFVFFFSCCQH